MLIYYIIWILLAFGALTDLLYKRWYDKRILNLFLCIILILFIGLRFECDRDFTTYVSHWGNLPYFSAGNFAYLYEKFRAVDLEFGYKFVAVILKNLGFTPQAMFVFCAAVTFTIFYKVIPYYTNYPNIALFIYFSQFIMLPFMQIRFGVCSMLIWYSFYMWSHNKKRTSILYYILAITFHNLSFGVLILLPLLKLSIKKMLILLGLVLFIPLHVVSDIALGAVYLMGWNYTGYFDSDQSLSYLSYILNFILVLPIVIYYLNNSNMITIVNRRLIKYYILFLIGFSLSLNLPIIARIAITFSISICFLLPSYFSVVPKDARFRFLILIGIVIYGGLKFIPALKFFEPYKFNLELI